ncbi:hypothetical protein EMPS_04983 [Entomortierella parvispora]|uniref:VTT domain-containing protein n=1 Tax=Entomortierella parvispora TaxID=205924 RepID=A0A9P3LWA9_9FUNG|nr:hypothetical protein EMPS_04983 [Entomortierella parvispora]
MLSISQGTAPALDQQSNNTHSVVRTHYDDDSDDENDTHGSPRRRTNGERTPLMGTPVAGGTRLLQDSRDHSLHTLHFPESSTGSRTGTGHVALPTSTIVPVRTNPEDLDSEGGDWKDWMVRNGVHPRTWTGQTYLKAGLLSILLTLVILAFTVFRVQDHIKDILHYIDDHKSIGAVLFVTFYTVACWLFLPGSLFTIGAGFLFKPMPFALAIVLLGDILGALGSFLFGRYIFYDWVKGMMSKHPKFGALDQVIQDDGWKIVVMLRLTPIPFNLITYFFSITSIRLTTLIWATALGVFPGSCLGIWIGSLLKGLSGIDDPELETRHVVILIMNGVFIVCSILTLSLFGKRSMRKAMAQLDRHQQIEAAAAASLEQHQRQLQLLQEQGTYGAEGSTTATDVAVAVRPSSSSISSLESETVVSTTPNLHAVKKIGTDPSTTTTGSLSEAETETDGLLHRSDPEAGARTVPTGTSSGFTRGEQWTFVGIAIAAVINICVCIPLYFHFKDQLA